MSGGNLISPRGAIPKPPARRRDAARHLLHPRQLRDSLTLARQPSLRNATLAGLQAGLSALPSGYVFVMACDMPQVSGKLLALLASAIDGENDDADVVHVVGQPFHALYHTRVAGIVGEALRNRDYRVMRLLARLKTIEVQPEADGLTNEEGLYNLNTPEDYRNYMDGMRRDER